MHAYAATYSVFSDNEHMTEREKLVSSLLHFSKRKCLALSVLLAMDLRLGKSPCRLEAQALTWFHFSSE